MSDLSQNPCIICVAITGSVPTKASNPAVPITIAEQIESTQESFEAGASIAHCHVPDENGAPTSAVTTPSYWISTVDDHIAPWKSTYEGARCLAGPVRFVLGGSGHIAGIVNPPAANKYGHWTHSDTELPESADDWLASAKQNEGSWWTDWQAWLTGLDATQVAARDPAAGKLEVIEDAPGSYVKLRLDKTAR